MKIRTLLAPGLIVALYMAWPYATLLKLRHDLRRHDVQALRGDIDWKSVRSGLKADILDSLEGRPVATKISAVSGDDLPPFGASFAAGMAGHAVDQQVTPQRIADAFLAPRGSQAAQPKLESAGFDGPTHFSVKFGTADSAPIRLQMSLVRQGWLFDWVVTRVWLPGSVLQQNS